MVQIGQQSKGFYGPQERNRSVIQHSASASSLETRATAEFAAYAWLLAWTLLRTFRPEKSEDRVSDGSDPAQCATWIASEELQLDD
jgi:hypothetical protein